MCRRSEDVISVTLNHLDMIRQFVSSSDTHVAMVNAACRTLTDVSLYEKDFVVVCLQPRGKEEGREGGRDRGRAGVIDG